MITPDGWLDWTVRVPGPPEKQYPTPNAGIGYVPHSAVGYYGGWAQRLFSMDRRPDGRFTAYAAASIHGWIAYDGTVTQHYPLTASCWGSGSEYPNTSFIAFENEGGHTPEDEPLTPAQVAANVRIIQELAAWRGWNGFRRPADANDQHANLYEHRECVRFGSAATACPSNRIPWDVILAELGAAGAPPPPPPPVESGRTVLVHLETGVDAVMDIDEYAKGVLPYEMSTGWPLEALKAQAVAAKSYALAAGSVFTDTRSQVYGPARYPDTDAAVEQVRGVYLGWQGQVIMPFYFGHCPSHTRSPSQAGWNPVADRPYLIGVDCPCGRTAYFGHGIGMCQRGAQVMAERGATFDQILRHYYSGIELLGFDPAAQPVAPANSTLYVVQPGDSLSIIAGKFGLDWSVIYVANRGLIGADPNILTPGWQLVIPRPAEEQNEPQIYVVQPGDTLWALSRRWNTTVDAIVAKNGIANESVIRVGQRIVRP